MKYLLFIFFISCWACTSNLNTKKNNIQLVKEKDTSMVSLIVLGTIQDAGSPHIGCKKECCTALFNNSDATRKVVSLGVVDYKDDKTYLFEATPDITAQLKNLKQFAGTEKELPDGIFITHAHIGHYTGLIYLGKEAINATQTPIYVMPKMKTFLEENGPWSQLVTQKNMNIQLLENQKNISLTSQLKVTPYTVPHRDEFSETVGFKIEGPYKKALFIPDIDKWHKWDKNIIDEIKKVDFAFLDATFYHGEEINTRDVSLIPHPFIEESMRLFKDLPLSEKNKIYFIHFNHTNPVLNNKSEAYKKVIEEGYHITKFGSKFEL